MLLTNIINQPHLIHILYSIIYNRDVHFIGELIRDVDYFSNNKNEVKKTTISILSYLINSNQIIIERKDSENNVIRVYDRSNIQELTDLIYENWNEFLDSDNVKVWYSYQIGFTDFWKNELQKIGMWKNKN